MTPVFIAGKVDAPPRTERPRLPAEAEEAEHVRCGGRQCSIDVRTTNVHLPRVVLRSHELQLVNVACSEAASQFF
jgi:hypothetical protein